MLSAIVWLLSQRRHRGQFSVSTERIGELHLARCPTLGLEKARRRDYDANALRSRNGNVQSVGAVEELHSARRIRVTGGRHGINDNRSLLALKFVYGADASAGNALLQLEDLRIVGRDDQDIVERNLSLVRVSIHPSRAGFQYVRN